MTGSVKQTSSGVRSFWIAFTAGIGLIMAAGIVYGRYSHRWGPTPDLLSAARSLESLPSQVGEWQLQSEEEIGSSTIRMLECTGYVNRRYVSSRSGDTVVLAILAGPPGPIAVHTPEICYSSRNYKIADGREAIRLKGAGSRPHTFWNTTFESKNAFGERLSVFYAWSDGEEWAASRSPRYEFAASPQLFKLQLAGLRAGPDGSEGNDPSARFLKALLNSGWTLGVN